MKNKQKKKLLQEHDITTVKIQLQIQNIKGNQDKKDSNLQRSPH